MVLLCCHVQRCEPILGLDIDASRVSHQDLDNFILAGKARNVQRCVAFLGGRVNLCSSAKKFSDNCLVAFLACQVQGIEAILETTVQKVI